MKTLKDFCNSYLDESYKNTYNEVEQILLEKNNTHKDFNKFEGIISKTSVSVYNNIKVIEVKFEDLEVKLATLGASIIDIKYIDKNKIKESIVTHPTNIKDFINNPNYYGKTCGQTSGRIDNGIVKLNNKTYHLDKNWNDTANLHGGANGVSDQIFTLNKIKEEENIVTIEMELKTLDLILPGINLIVEYIITNDEIHIKYNATCDTTTLCNITNHTYFNLTGNCKNNALDHYVYLNSNKYTILNDIMIPTKISKTNKVFDFTKEKQLKEDIYDEQLQNHMSLGYDHCFILNKTESYQASLYDEVSKRKLEVYTTYPNIVMYSCCYGSDYICSNKNKISQYDAICLEAQYMPNGINMDVADNSILHPNKKFHEEIKFKFKIK